MIDLINKNVQRRVRIGRIDLLKSFSFFEVDEKQAQTVISALNKASVGGRKVNAEIAGEESGSTPPRGERRSSSPGRREGGYQPGGARRPATPAARPAKPSREERGYTSSRGAKKKDDWQKFFNGEEPDFSEEGWARRKPKKK